MANGEKLSRKSSIRGPRSESEGRRGSDVGRGGGGGGRAGSDKRGRACGNASPSSSRTHSHQRADSMPPPSPSPARSCSGSPHKRNLNVASLPVIFVFGVIRFIAFQLWVLFAFVFNHSEYFIPTKLRDFALCTTPASGAVKEQQLETISSSGGATSSVQPLDHADVQVHVKDSNLLQHVRISVPWQNPKTELEESCMKGKPLVYTATYGGGVTAERSTNTPQSVLR
jgi:hypothetical protein